uniref:long-chain-fatty-acid--CoA ligase n=1 Tax=Falco tinnunculus TaxID=100819 RepID=A0A8C4UL98_FALTI
MIFACILLQNMVNTFRLKFPSEFSRSRNSAFTQNTDQDHKVRLAIGNGVRADKVITTNSGILEDEPVRDENRYCIRVPKGKPGLLICKITQYAPFNGYTGAKHQTEKKQLRDVFQKGDSYFNSKIITIDCLFSRWKGENVSTTEVADVLGLLDCVQEVIVYGISVPGYEGKTGTVCIRLKENWEFNGESTYRHVKAHLPSYARPHFIRIKVNECFQYRKLQLVEESFNPAVIKDRLYFLDDRENLYVQMTQDIYNSVKKHDVKL